MSCECYQIGGRFIAEDPDCPAHGSAAQAEREDADRERALHVARMALEFGSPREIEEALRTVVRYLESL